DTYIQWNTMMYETFFAEEPRAKDWIQRDQLGQPILLTYGYQQSYRYRPCFANQNYLDYPRKSCGSRSRRSKPTSFISTTSIATRSPIPATARNASRDFVVFCARSIPRRNGTSGSGSLMSIT